MTTARLVKVEVFVKPEECRINADGDITLDERKTGFFGLAAAADVAPLICHGWLA